MRPAKRCAAKATRSDADTASVAASALRQPVQVRRQARSVRFRELRRDEARELGGAAFNTDEDGETYELRGISRLDYSAVQVPADDFPRFDWRPPELPALARQAALDLLLLLSFGTFLAAFVFLRFQRYDCR